MTIETLFFDLGGVLIDFSHEKMCKNIADLCDLDLDMVKGHLFEKNLSEMYERGIIDSKTLYEHFCQLSAHTFSFEDLMLAASDIFKVKEEMPPLLESLKKQGLHLFLLSNTCEAHIEYAKKNFPFLGLFDGLILSYEVAARKPEPEIFDAALEHAQASAEGSFFTDDVEMHVAAAKNCGIDSHHFVGKEELVLALAERGIDA